MLLRPYLSLPMDPTFRHGVYWLSRGGRVNNRYQIRVHRQKVFSCGKIRSMNLYMNYVPSNINTASLPTTPKHAHTHTSLKRMFNKIPPWKDTDAFVAATSPGPREFLKKCCHYCYKKSFETKLGSVPVFKTVIIGCMLELWIPTERRKF